jgi:hypothetical protein
MMGKSFPNRWFRRAGLSYEMMLVGKRILRKLFNNSPSYACLRLPLEAKIRVFGLPMVRGSMFSMIWAIHRRSWITGKARLSMVWLSVC